jgi:hypothetical protein
MNDDPRCCGSGTCIIDKEGRCWCGQLWDGEKMCHTPLAQAPAIDSVRAEQPPIPPQNRDS